MGESLPIYSFYLRYFSEVFNVASTNSPPNYYKVSGCPKVFSASSGRCDDSMLGFNSMHTGGVHLAMADGSVRFLGENINYATYQYLGNRSDGNVVSAD